MTGIVDFVALKLNVHEPLKYDKPAVDTTTPLQPDQELLLADMYKLTSVHDYINYHRAKVLKKSYRTLEDWKSLT